MNNNKNIKFLVIAVLVSIVASVGLTYAYFTASISTDGKITSNVKTSSRDIFTTSGSSTLDIEVTNTFMEEDDGADDYSVSLSDSGTITISLTAGSDTATCDYDLAISNSGSVAYTKSPDLGGLFEYTVQGTDGTQRFDEINVDDAMASTKTPTTADDLTKQVSSGILGNYKIKDSYDKGDTQSATTQEWTITTKFYNLNKLQDAQENKKYSYDVKVVNVHCENNDSSSASSDDEQEQLEVPEELKKYILGEDLLGQPFYYNSYSSSSSGIYDFWNDKYVDSNIINVEEIKELGKETLLTYYIEYKNVVYKYKNITIDGTLYTDASTGIQIIGRKISSINSSTIKVGSTIYYNDKEWIVMYINDENIEIISKDPINYKGNALTLGPNDTYLTEKGILQGTTQERAIYSYNNVVTTLNNACKEIVDTTPSYIIDVRSVGSNPNDKASENKSLYSSEYLDENPQQSPGIYNNIIKNYDENWVYDYEQLILLNANNTEDKYWMASRLGGTNISYEQFRVRMVDTGTLDSNTIFSVNKSEADGKNVSYKLRPIVKIDKTKCNFKYDESNNYFTIVAK